MLHFIFWQHLVIRDGEKKPVTEEKTRNHSPPLNRPTAQTQGFSVTRHNHMHSKHQHN